jgi:hypothetical protein
MLLVRQTRTLHHQIQAQALVNDGEQAPIKARSQAQALKQG